jgi:hypothetical protein|tara:strand:- start:34804 stop:34983 length:180 start_codon:yes stop_codon:yes gene_type:complete
VQVSSKAFPGESGDAEIIEMIVLVIVAPVGWHGELLPITRRNVEQRQLFGMFLNKSAVA